MENTLELSLTEAVREEFRLNEVQLKKAHIKFDRACELLVNSHTKHNAEELYPFYHHYKEILYYTDKLLSPLKFMNNKLKKNTIDLEIEKHFRSKKSTATTNLMDIIGRNKSKYNFKDERQKPYLDEMQRQLVITKEIPRDMKGLKRIIKIGGTVNYKLHNKNGAFLNLKTLCEENFPNTELPHTSYMYNIDEIRSILKPVAQESMEETIVEPVKDPIKEFMEKSMEEQSDEQNKGETSASAPSITMLMSSASVALKNDTLKVSPSETTEVSTSDMKLNYLPINNLTSSSKSIEYNAEILSSKESHSRSVSNVENHMHYMMEPSNGDIDVEHGSPSLMDAENSVEPLVMVENITTIFRPWE